MRLIGLHARLQAGKDTAYETIEKAAETENVLAVRRAFADPLKLSAMHALGQHYDKEKYALILANTLKESGRITVSYETADGLQSFVISGREFLQYYGTEAHRDGTLGSSFGTDFWVDNLLPVGNVPSLSLSTVSIPVPENGELPEYAKNQSYERPKFWDNFKESYAGYADIAVVTDVRFPNEAERILELDGEIWWIDAESRLGPNTSTHPSEKKLHNDYITKVIDNNYGLAEFQNNILDALNS